MTAHPWLKPCPTCNRKHCGWHDRHGLCDAPFPDTAEAVIAEAEEIRAEIPQSLWTWVGIYVASGLLGLALAMAWAAWWLL